MQLFDKYFNFGAKIIKKIHTFASRNLNIKQL